jgi:hypothetical protein
MSWWRTSKGRTQALLTAFGLVALVGMFAAGSKYLIVGDQRVLVVTMATDVTQADRDELKRSCGSLPGVGVVADRGAPERQYRFPVRFSLRDATPQQEAALEGCVSDHSDKVRGFLLEGDGNSRLSPAAPAPAP